MAEAKDKNETFKNILLELMASNETLDKINANTLNASETGLEAAASLESLVANQSLSNSGGSAVNDDGSQPQMEFLTEGMISILNLIANDSLRTVVALNAISQVMSDTFDLNKSEALKNEEDRREGKKNNNKERAAVPKKEKMNSSFGIMGTLAAIAGLVIGFVAGVVASLAKTFKSVMTAIGQLLKLDVLLGKIGITPERIQKLFRPISDFFTRISQNISKAIQFVKASIAESKFFQSIKKFFEPLRSVFSFFTKEGSFLSKLSGMFGKVGAVFSNLGGIFKFALKFGVILGKLAGPIGIAISAITSIFDGFKVFEKTGDIGAAIEVGVVGFINAFTGNILDLLKDAVSWIAGALGFTGVEEFLDSFSFTDIIAELFNRSIKAGRDMFEKFFQNFVDIFGDISKKFSEGDIIGGIVEIFRGFLKTIATLVVDIPKNLLASAAEGLGFDGVAKSMREFSLSELLGGTNTKTGGDVQRDRDTKSIAAAAGETTSAKKEQKKLDKLLAQAKEEQEKEQEKEQKKLEEANDGADEGEDELAERMETESSSPLNIFGSDTFGDFNKALVKNFNRTTNPAGAAITPAKVENVGSHIAALGTNTADMAKDAAGRAASSVVAPVTNTKNSTTNNSSVTIQQSNLPDRTALSLRPAWVFPGGY
jgi:hypothetical protein